MVFCVVVGAGVEAAGWVFCAGAPVCAVEPDDGPVFVCALGAGACALGVCAPVAEGLAGCVCALGELPV